MKEKPDQTLSEFGKCAMSLAELLEHDPQLGLIEQIFIENHIHVLHLAYSTWKRRNTAGKDQPTDASGSKTKEDPPRRN